MAISTERRPSLEERVSYIEGVLPHLATKADVAGVLKELAEFRAEFRAELARSEARLMRWGIAALGVAIAAITILDRLLG